MEKKILYKTSYDWFLSLLIIMFVGSFYFIIDTINNFAGTIYIIADIIFVLALLPKKVIFYENRIEIIKLNRFLKKKVFLFTDILKIEYRYGVVVRAPPMIFIFANEGKPKKYINSFVAPSNKVTKELLNELHNKGVKIEFNCDKERIVELKSW